MHIRWSQPPPPPPIFLLTSFEKKSGSTPVKRYTFKLIEFVDIDLFTVYMYSVYKNSPSYH